MCKGVGRSCIDIKLEASVLTDQIVRLKQIIVQQIIRLHHEKGTWNVLGIERVMEAPVFRRIRKYLLE